jgi:uncharacterized damage-inducible protein DinB
MSSDREVLERAIDHALSGRGAHVEARISLEELDWKMAGTHPGGVEHSIFQLVNHMIYWQEWLVKWLGGEDPTIPEHASGSWPGSPGPASREEWGRVVERFGTLVDQLSRQSREDDLFSMRVSVGTRKSRLEMLHTVASHNSYHLGQVVILRQMLGAWPPPSGGLTW